jgi:hypothetical protein
MRRYVAVLMVIAVGVVAVGCGQRGDQRTNDPGPPIEFNKNGPGPMKPPDPGGAGGVPQNMEKPKT